MEQCIRIGSLNCWGLRGLKKARILVEWLCNTKCNIILLQETHITKKVEKHLKTLWAGEIYHSYAKTAHANGVCIMFDANLDYKILDVKHDHEGRILLIKTRIRK